MELWTENDIEFQLGLENWEEEVVSGHSRFATAPKRLFHTWREDWEKVSVRLNDVVHEAKLLHKYGGMRWIDPGTGNMCCAETDNMEWRRGLGWCDIGMNESGELEPWPIKVLPSLIKVTVQEPDSNVEMVHLSKAEKSKKRKARSIAAAASPEKTTPNKKKGKKGRPKKCESSDSSLSSNSDAD